MAAEHEPMPRDQLVIFRGAGAPSLAEADMSTGRSHVGGEPVDDFFSDAIVKDFTSSVPYRQDAPDGMSLVRLDIPPGGMLPRHSHSADCLYYLVSGQVLLGQRELGPGDGFYVPADQPYGYSVGREGAVLLEFRGSTAFDTRFHEKDPAHFRAKAEASIAAAKAVFDESD